MKQLDSTSAIRVILPGYHINQHIYESVNSLVYRAIRKQDTHPVILKMLKSDSPQSEERTRYKQEYEITRRLDVAGVIKAYSLEAYRHTLVLILEDFGGVSLDHWLEEWTRAGTAAFPLSQFLKLASQMVAGVAQLHTAGVIHKNITSSNIVFNPDTGELKLIDCGLATALNREIPTLKSPQILEGTLAYLSPEQTGRMNRTVDYRTDFYSLGVTFYELLTGQLPFTSHDPLALVHAHMAKIPQPVVALNPAVPPLLSDLVMKLLAKNAEDRYQSAFGLKADLERCLTVVTALHGTDSLDDLRFELGQDDYSGQFHIPEKLYGRTGEIATLLTAFDRVAKGSQEFLLVAGSPGVGKSALAAEIHKPITEKHGYFISGKFDQYQQHTPYAAFSQAFNQLADVLLTEPESTLHQWRDTIVAAVGGNGAVLTEVIPHLEKVIGPQPAVPKLGGSENRNRFNLTVQNFVQALSTAEHPLVVFIDDWQWADLASLELLKVLLTGDKLPHVLLIGAYRDTEVDRIHPFMTTLNDLAAAGTPMQTIELGNLRVKDVRHLIQESLACSPAESQVLTELVSEKTQGNAFFTRQFLQNLYEEGWLRFNVDTRGWMWDMTQLKAQQMTDNVLELMIGKLKRLPQQTTHLLQVAACIGNEFDLQTLALIDRMSEPATLEGLTEALNEGLVSPLDEYYKLSDTAGQACFRFLHDRVQQAAYAQISASERQTVHLEIGRLLLANTPDVDVGHRVFEIVQHYNQADRLITDETERLRVAELNMHAADLAYRSVAFSSTRVYLEQALALMPADAWTRCYDQMLALHSQLATVLSLTGDFDQLEKVVQVTNVQAHTVAETARVTQAKIQILFAQGDFLGALELGLKFIELLGVSLNQDPSPEEAMQYFHETAEWLTKARIESLPRLPAPPAEVALSLEFALALYTPTYVAKPFLFIVLNSQLTRLCIEQGFVPEASAALINFATLLSSVLHDVPKARHLTDITRKLFEEKYRSNSLGSFLNSIIGSFIIHRYDHLKHILPVLSEGFQQGLASGNFEAAAYSVWSHAWHHLLLGVSLSQIESINQQAVDACQKMQRPLLKTWCLLNHQVILNLQGRSAVAWILKGENYDEEKSLAFAFQANDFGEVFRIFFYKAWLHYLFDRPQVAVDFFREAEPYFMNVAGMYLATLFYFYDTLANLAVYSHYDPAEQPQILDRINHNLKEFEVWVRFAPMNHQHKHDLMEAEKARREGRYWEAVELYQQAIQGAEDNEFLHEEALANELCGQFWFEQGHQEIAHVYLHTAHNLYGLWGAGAKVEQLQAKYGQEFDHRQIQPQDISEVVGVTRIDQSPTSNKRAAKSWLDITSLLKANHILSQTVQLNDLLAEMMKILLENAGAEKACILYQSEGDWFIEAEGQVTDPTMQTGLHIPLSETAMLSMRVFNYVVHSGQAVVLPDATADLQFGTEAYLREHGVKSVLCVPIWHKSALQLVVYLENNVAVGAFTESRLEMLQMLSTQMAISLENALMVDSLNTLIAELKRTEAEREKLITELEVQNTELERFTYTVSHDLKSPLVTVTGFLGLLEQDAIKGDMERLRKDIQYIREATDTMQQLLNELLELSRIGRLMNPPQEVAFEELVRGALARVAGPLAERQIDVTVAPPLPWVAVDRPRLIEVLQNLIENAIKFLGEQTEPRIDIGVTHLGDDVVFYVADNGIGIAPQYQEKIFGLFERLDPAVEGTGVGLALVKRIIEVHGGRIWVESDGLGRGSTFYFTLGETCQVLKT